MTAPTLASGRALAGLAGAVALALAVSGGFGEAGAADLVAQVAPSATASGGAAAPGPPIAPAAGAPADTAAPAATVPAAAPPSAPTPVAPAPGALAPAAPVAPPVAVPAPPPRSVATPAPPAPAARASLIPLAQPLWSELTPAQRQVLGPLEPQWNGLPANSKRSWLTVAERVPKMPAAEREKALERIQEWARLTPEQRRLARNNYRLARTLAPEDRVATWETYQQLTPEQRAVLSTSGWTSNTAARHAGAPTGLAKEAARPLSSPAPRTLPPPAAGSSARTSAGTVVAPSPTRVPSR